MWLTLAKAVLGFVGGPAIKAATDAYKAKLDSKSKHEVLAADLAARELQVQQKEIEVQGQLKIAQVGHFWEVEKLFGYILAAYFGKIIFWDKVMGSFFGFTDNIFNTDPITGETLQWASLVLMFYFGKRAFENAARIFKS